MADLQQETHQPHSRGGALQQIDKGDIITYLLPPGSGPSNPFREWHGRVEWVGPELVKVTVLDEGYAGETEFVMRTAIVSVMGSQVPDNRNLFP
ncbi:MAG TPA: hypothetical protein VKB35_14535 [Ktedonobacteraceae bacterium]|nr:hypothetical protein [Ktedonobacteraceae bacterium]